MVDPSCPHLSRVTPNVDKNGNSLGAFGDGELLWHSNESADVAFTPNVALLAWENVVGSATGFCTSSDWYDKQTESFQSELDEMVAIHNYRTESVSPHFNPDQEANYRIHFASEQNARIPLVIKSPGGIKGIHLGVNTLDRIEGLCEEESRAMICKLKNEIIATEYIYDHWYASDKEIVVFDNSITLHNRSTKSGSTPGRIAYRLQHDLDCLIGGDYEPFYQDEYNKSRLERISDYRLVGQPRSQQELAENPATSA
jgi:alpha-ketoglutarate-dependent taurine dioxygenase